MSGDTRHQQRVAAHAEQPSKHERHADHHPHELCVGAAGEEAVAQSDDDEPNT